jgi:hypothetical protein
MDSKHSNYTYSPMNLFLASEHLAARMGEETMEVLKKVQNNKKKSIILPNESWRWDTILEQAADESQSKSRSESEEGEEDWFENWLD